MTHREISHQRLVSQKLLETSSSSPQEIVHHLGAMQAQDYSMAKWAIGSRCDATEKEIEETINLGEIIRTHILRPTWHFVSADDIYWMLDVSGPQVKRIILAETIKYGYDEKEFDKINSRIEKMLAGNNHLTRDEIIQELNVKKVTGEYFLSPVLIMMYAELDGLVCSGKTRGKQMTYALLEERVSKPKSKLTKEEGLTKLALKYFESHVPATLHDFSWWSGFPTTICKQTINAIELQLNSVEIDGQKYWFGKDYSLKNNFRESVHFIPAFDEILISYKTREVSILIEHQSMAFTNNGIFKPVILENGKVIGTWKRTLKKDHGKIETQFFNETESHKKAILFEGIKAFENYLETKILIE
ncbi:winged helix DNA-binding domain-containing protein [Flavobacterium sp. Fl-77]|uniref:Winged helix DNA-binding domain-containing protein n=1 Tax=Flavobacterium flavipigmentatum TaxID=2893884 RepID=A0AAJ2S6J5_9FLAO|nr:MULTISPECIES: winged helix DNA-binding domain-containing protein [unclassified Flavobacterium]MDX6180871.1 winged helix DNA-binding domain-containing protein [Flavobacterium sp. Fl-33]MDX6184472.1 winged helix DNA-binding domain-containing protein [Flavobacterium sp. Fl-77]UFH39580.1 winged helix DNA-binding domain-containing protein [Flavobacterium sp. F-70]